MYFCLNEDVKFWYRSVEVDEAFGLYHALEWWSDMQFDHIDLEVDSKITNNAFHSNRVDILEFGHIIYMC